MQLASSPLCASRQSCFSCRRPRSFRRKIRTYLGKSDQKIRRSQPMSSHLGLPPWDAWGCNVKIQSHRRRATAWQPSTWCVAPTSLGCWRHTKPRHQHLGICGHGPSGCQRCFISRCTRILDSHVAICFLEISGKSTSATLPPP